MIRKLLMMVLALMLLVSPSTVMAEDGEINSPSQENILYMPFPPVVFTEHGVYETWGAYCYQTDRWIRQLYDYGYIVVAVYPRARLIDQEPYYLEIWSDICPIVVSKRTDA